MPPEEVTQLVVKFVNDEFKKLNSKNKIHCECSHAGNWWLSEPNHWNYQAGARATEKVYGVKPDYTREGGSIPVTLTFEQELKKNVLLLPMVSIIDYLLKLSFACFI